MERPTKGRQWKPRLGNPVGQRIPGASVKGGGLQAVTNFSDALALPCIRMCVRMDGIGAQAIFCKVEHGGAGRAADGRASGLVRAY